MWGCQGTNLIKSLSLWTMVGSIVCYNSNMPPHMRSLWARSVDAAHVCFISDTEYFTLNEG